jgi:pyruvate/2-oxoglutarate dehydrogenase complex dihydrolipoamide acyltransferase (E2) component
MSTEILLPKIGFSVNEASIQDWLAADGTTVTAGQPLFNVESDKSVTEIEAPASGILRIIVSPGETVAVGTVLGKIE